MRGFPSRKVCLCVACGPEATPGPGQGQAGVEDHLESPRNMEGGCGLEEFPVSARGPDFRSQQSAK